jgi:cysteinyl-tRNA synthetase
MGRKYLGEQFDIHGGGMDLLFPHHESEIAQSQIANGNTPCKYWMHNNMITINGQKMGKSLGNSIMLKEFFSGDHKMLEQAYTPMAIRFFILQAHYRSTLDFSNTALQAAEKGLSRLLKVFDTLDILKPSNISSVDINSLKKDCFAALNDDLNSPVAISVLFDGVRIINSINEGKETLTKEDIESLKNLYSTVIFDILGLKKEEKGNTGLTDYLIKFVLDLRQRAKENKDFATSDKIRDELKSLGITVKDTKDGAVWEIS